MTKLITYCTAVTLFCFFSCSKETIKSPEPKNNTFLSFGFRDGGGQIDTTSHLILGTDQPLNIAFLYSDSVKRALDNGGGFKWTLSNGDTFSDFDPQITVEEPGSYQLKLEVSDKSGHLLYAGQRGFQVFNRKLVEVEVKKWHWESLFSPINWPATQKASVYFAVKKFNSWKDASVDYNGKTVFQSDVLTEVSPTVNPILKLTGSNNKPTPFPFKLQSNQSDTTYAYQLIAMDSNGKEYLLQTSILTGIPITNISDIRYYDAMIHNGEFHYGFGAQVGVYFNLNIE